MAIEPGPQPLIVTDLVVLGELENKPVAGRLRTTTRRARRSSPYPARRSPRRSIRPEAARRHRAIAGPTRAPGAAPSRALVLRQTIHQAGEPARARTGRAPRRRRPNRSPTRRSVGRRSPDHHRPAPVPSARSDGGGAARNVDLPRGARPARAGAPASGLGPPSTRAHVSKKLRMRNTTSMRSIGFVRKSFAPASSARTRAAGVASAVRTTTGRNTSGARRSFSCCRTAKPSICGMCRSSNRMSGRNSRQRLTAASGSVSPSRLTTPSARKIVSSNKTFASRSSTISTRALEKRSASGGEPNWRGADVSPSSVAGATSPATSPIGLITQPLEARAGTLHALLGAKAICTGARHALKAPPGRTVNSSEGTDAEASPFAPVRRRSSPVQGCDGRLPCL